tara:strand:- start:11847 stop:12434 length:588 start_codon:yes stop_codon:yes gene_type:complete
MERFTRKNINTPELSEKIFKEKWNEDVHTVDGNRFDELARDFKGGRYLDIGCFNSPKLGELAEIEGNEIHGIDHAKRVIDVMSLKFPNVNYKVGDCYELPYEDEYFDYIVSGELLEHLEVPQEMIAEAMRVLKSGGTMAISTPYMEGRGQSLISDEHLWSFGYADMSELFDQYGRVEITVNSDNVKVFLVYVTKN